MTQVVQDGFGVIDAAETRKDFETESQKPDELWVARLAPIPVGNSFTVNRPEGETVRQFKKRINRAAMVHWKTLEWKSKDTNLPDGVEPTHFQAKIKALDLKAKAEAEQKAAQATTSQNGQNGTSEPPQTTGDQNPPPDTSEGNEPTGPRGARNRP